MVVTSIHNVFSMVSVNASHFGQRTCGPLMQATLFFIGVFPPPSSRTKVFSGSYGAGAGSASDADKTPVVQNIVGYVVLIYIFLHLLGGPMQQRIVFDDLIAFVPLDQCMVFSLGGMFSP